MLIAALEKIHAEIRSAHMVNNPEETLLRRIGLRQAALITIPKRS